MLSHASLNTFMLTPHSHHSPHLTVQSTLQLAVVALLAISFQTINYFHSLLFLIFSQHFMSLMFIFVTFNARVVCVQHDDREMH